MLGPKNGAIETDRVASNLYIHGDHTAGYATFAKIGAVLFARDGLDVQKRCRRR